MIDSSDGLDEATERLQEERTCGRTKSTVQKGETELHIRWVGGLVLYELGLFECFSMEHKTTKESLLGGWVGTICGNSVTCSLGPNGDLAARGFAAPNPAHSGSKTICWGRSNTLVQSRCEFGTPNQIR